MTPSALLNLEDKAFLKEIVSRYPEAIYLAGKAEASPEGNQTLKPDALAYEVFGDDIKIDDTAIEADRTFVGLLTLKWLLNGDYAQFTNPQNATIKLSKESFDKLRSYTQNVIENDDDLEFVLYSLSCNDLGKTLFLVEEHKRAMGHYAEDHDQLLYKLMQERPTLFPAFENKMSKDQKFSYVKGLGANLNLGQFVQGENLPVNLFNMQAIDVKSCELRLICEIFDFAGAVGHINASGSTLMTEDNHTAFSQAIEELIIEPKGKSYQRYIERRLKHIGLDKTNSPKETFALGRIVALSRSFQQEQGVLIQNVWNNLTTDIKETLIEEMNVTGHDGQKGILIYYAPALISNTIKVYNDFEKGLAQALTQMAEIYTQTRQDENNSSGHGVITVNVNALANNVLKESA